MIQHVTVDHNTHDAVCEAARDAGLSYDQMLAWVVSDWATTYRRRKALTVLALCQATIDDIYQA